MSYHPGPRQMDLLDTLTKKRAMPTREVREDVGMSRPSALQALRALERRKLVWRQGTRSGGYVWGLTLEGAAFVEKETLEVERLRGENARLREEVERLRAELAARAAP